MVNKDEFFREVTVRICSSLDVKTALKRAFDYMSLHLPLDTLSINIQDVSLKAIRRIATIVAGSEQLDQVIHLPKEVWQRMQDRQPIPTIIHNDQDEYFTLLAPYIRLKGNSLISVPLTLDAERIGTLVLGAHGEGRYLPCHLKLITRVANPFAIALVNALSYEKLLKYSDRLLDDNHFLSKELIGLTGPVIGAEGGLRHVAEMVRQVAPLNNTVLLLGETGTGKEVIANAIHAASPRKNGPFIKVNCGAIPENLLDSELFGHEKGAFTGAASDYRGRFERADGGTIFLDEIGELPPAAQVRLLRVLQNREIERVGGSRPIPIDIRVIAATHRNLERMVSKQDFREDLWFRLNVFPIIVPPLRQRKEDILPLTRFFIKRKSQELGMDRAPELAPGAIERLVNYSWRGNVRELENLVERELILHQGGKLRFELLPLERREELHQPPRRDGAPVVLRLDEAMARHLSDVLKIAKGKIYGPNGAAELLGVNPSTLRWRLDKLGIPHGRS
ncbi:sigma 54-interacting transcriptional regulator [Geomonas sp. Red32]|uniref:sigma-54-dependent Fis family transcriptional regulator n=1 Tax=Geomonas sp. Red32 TaxID=2912856 RepID=UPI00202CEC6E|nr:sigma 54-interacting transcriptional regulator [Geomonas sp. Red32]MCM0081228.1 sigma 54-interacting transcriptional regulator [Geomonas sp. Red32]